MSGCASVAVYARPLASVQRGFATAAPALREVYVGINTFRRDAYFVRLSCDPSRELVEVDAAGEQTPLSHDLFSADSIRARVEVIELLGRYFDRLAMLANPDTATDQRLSDASTTLGENLTQLGARFTSLPDATAREYATPVGQAVAAVLRAVQGQRRAAAVRRAMLDAAPHVRRVLDLLEADLDALIVTTRAPALDAVIARCATHYNTNRVRWSEAERRAALADMRRLVTQRATMQAHDPGALVRALRDAHEALVHLARAGAPQVGARDELARTIENFSQRVDAFVASSRAWGGVGGSHPVDPRGEPLQ